MQLHGAGFAFRKLHDLPEREGIVVGEDGDSILGEGVLLLHGEAAEEAEPGFPVAR